ncbi:MAG TPA: serine/threonine-protein kinase [Labilithrix sp.]|jgi:serine/threonine-protein kinase
MTRAFEAGHVLAGYRVEHELGRGAVGVVLAATSVRDGLRVALKVLTAGDDTAHARFLREARVAMSMRGDHNVRVLEVGELDDATPFLVMERLEGEDLDKLLARDGPQPAGRVISWAIDVCDALEEAHALGAVHRDLKPANLFLARGVKGAGVKVLDFGLAKAPLGEDGPKLTASLAVMGSPAYMAPEQLVSSTRIDARADLYSLGVAMYELLTGTLPFGDVSVAELAAAIVRDPPRPIRDTKPDVPGALAAIVERCMQKNPRDRYANASALRDALVAALVDPNEAPKTILMTHPPATAFPRRATPSRHENPARSHRLAIAAAVCVAILIVGVAVIATR